MTSKISNVLAILAVGGLLFVGSAAAQSATDNTSGAGPGVQDPGHPRVNQVNGREAHQQKRIGNGVANGTLTSKQATHLEKRETAVQKREKADMAAHNGHLTKAEQRGINRQQNRISRSIAHDKAVTKSKNQ
jgi:CRISPR/Cas system-associated endoribonuclease Cas2